jgi:membrane-associated protein
MPDTESLIRYGGLLLVFLAVFCQTGLFFCFFIPSGGLLFTAGVFAATGDLPESIYFVCSILILASLLGNITGYYLGLKAGPIMNKKKDSRFFKEKYIITAKSFYTKYGNIALSAGLFFPIIRTFSPIVAGMIKLNFTSFVFFTFIGSVLWILSHVMAGYLLGTMPFLQPYLKYIVAGIILTVTIPLVIGIFRSFNKTKNTELKFKE